MVDWGLESVCCFPKTEFSVSWMSNKGVLAFNREVWATSVAHMIEKNFETAERIKPRIPTPPL